MSSIKEAADLFLKEFGIIELLEEYGQSVVTGSYDLDLMIKKELDINLIVEELTSEKVFELLKRLALRTECIKVNYQNRATPETTIRVYGHWINLQQIGEDDWELDIWVLTRKENTKQDKFGAAIKEKLTQENREIIMTLKKHVDKYPRKPRLYSYIIYEAVLDHGIVNLESFLSYLHRLEVEE